MLQRVDPSPSLSALRCRIIGEQDLDAVVALLMRGFTDRTEAYWRRGLARHRDRSVPPGYPLYGYLLEQGGQAVGVLLTLHTETGREGAKAVRCNLSSWYVDPAFRAQGTLLDQVAVRRKEVTYLNVSPAPHTWAIQEARGFQRYCRGQMIALPALSSSPPGATVRLADPEARATLSPADRALVEDHQSYGCLCLVCTDASGSRPVVFQRRSIGLIPRVKRFGQVPCFQLIYCVSLEDLARFAGAIGRVLLRRYAMPWIVLDADAVVPGFKGKFFPGRAPKYTRGPHPVRLGDLAYTELVLFGP